MTKSTSTSVGPAPVVVSSREEFAVNSHRPRPDSAWPFAPNDQDFVFTEACESINWTFDAVEPTEREYPVTTIFLPEPGAALSCCPVTTPVPSELVWSCMFVFSDE